MYERPFRPLTVHLGVCMFSLFKRDPVKQLKKEIASKYEAATALQRNGKLREYGEAMQEIEQLEAKLDQLAED